MTKLIIVAPMILEPQKSARKRRKPFPEKPLPPILSPDWLRKANGASEGLAEIASTTGAALALLDMSVRRRDPWAGLWRQRLAMQAAVRAAHNAGRTETPETLRDARFFTRAGDDMGPSGRLLEAWRRLAAEPLAETIKPKALAATLGQFDLPEEDDAIDALATALGSAAGQSIPAVVAKALAAARSGGFGRTFGYWLVDAAVARALDWPVAVPLLGTQLPPGRRNAGRPPVDATADELLVFETKEMTIAMAALGASAILALDLNAEVSRRASKLLDVEPILRARASGGVVAQILSDDAVTGALRVPGMSTRGMRRMLDRLIELGAIRELTGRPTFRIYGL